MPKALYQDRLKIYEHELGDDSSSNQLTQIVSTYGDQRIFEQTRPPKDGSALKRSSSPKQGVVVTTPRVEHRTILMDQDNRTFTQTNYSMKTVQVHLNQGIGSASSKSHGILKNSRYSQEELPRDKQSSQEDVEADNVNRLITILEQDRK